MAGELRWFRPVYARTFHAFDLVSSERINAVPGVTLLKPICGAGGRGRRSDPAVSTTTIEKYGSTAVPHGPKASDYANGRIPRGLVRPCVKCLKRAEGSPDGR